MFAIWVLNLIAPCAGVIVFVKSVRVTDARIEAPLFCVGSVLLILAVDFGFLVWRRRRLQAAFTGILATGLLQASMMPWYETHAYPGPTGYVFHFHSIWDFGHVH